LDENKYIAAILMKLQAYGLSEKSINLLNSYLSGRKHCAKVKKYL